MHLLTQSLSILKLFNRLVQLNNIKLTPLLTMFCCTSNLERLWLRHIPSQTILSGIRKYSKDMREIDHQNWLTLRKVVRQLANNCKSQFNQDKISSSNPKQFLKTFQDLTRPVSNLCFVSKVVENAIKSQLRQHFTETNLMSTYQSAYRKGHSVESALTHVFFIDSKGAWKRGFSVYRAVISICSAGHN